MSLLGASIDLLMSPHDISDDFEWILWTEVHLLAVARSQAFREPLVPSARELKEVVCLIGTLVLPCCPLLIFISSSGNRT